MICQKQMKFLALSTVSGQLAPQDAPALQALLGRIPNVIKEQLMNSEKHQKQIDQVTIDDLSEADEVFGATSCFGTVGTAGCPSSIGTSGSFT